MPVARSPRIFASPTKLARPGNQSTSDSRRLATCFVSITAIGAVTCNAAWAQPTDIATARPSAAASVNFDEDMLKSRGISGSVADYFKHQARFTAGTRRVVLYINDQRKGTVHATFDSNGALCFDDKFLDSAGLRREKEVNDCARFLQQYPNTMIELHPGKEEVRLIVPTDALLPASVATNSYVTGGTAALLNYDALSVSNHFQGQSRQFQSLQTEAGLNVGDWILRSRQSYFKSDRQSRFEHLYAYGQKTFTDIGSTLQAGQINIVNSIFPGYRLNGAQITPEAALQRASLSTKTLVEGIANSPARIEVRQNGALIYSTMVPQGPYALTDIPLLNTSSDLEVTVSETGGSSSTYTVPAAELISGTLGGTPGYSLAIGQYDPYGSSELDKPMLATGSGTWSLNDKTNATAGIMASQHYHAGGWAIDRILTPTTFASARQLVSRAQREGVSGTQLSVSLSSQLTPSVSASFGASQQTSGFRDLGDSVDKRAHHRWFDSRYKSQYSGTLGWSNQSLGGLYGSYSQSSTFDGRKIQRMTGTWSKTFKGATFSLNVQHSGGDTGRFGAGNSVLFSISAPLGGRSFRTYVDHTSERTRTGASVSEQVNDYVAYNISADYDDRQRDANVSGNVSILPRYLQTNLGYAKNGSSSTMYSGQIRGGIAIHKEGATLSPYAITDTFGIAKVGDVTGVRISTPQGPVWTDAAGRAVVPQLTPYQTSRLEISTKSLPRNIDLVNGYQAIDAGRGTVQYVDFGIISTRRALLTAKQPNGEYLPKGAAIMNGKGEFITTVLDKGKIFLPNADTSEPLHVEMSQGDQCKLAFELNEKPDLSNYYEHADALCTPP